MELNNNKYKEYELPLFYSIWGYLAYFMTALFILIFSILFLLLPFNRHKKLTNKMIKFFCRIFYFINFKQKNHFDFNHIQKPEPCEKRIYIANHTSIFDSITIYSLPGTIKTIMKRSYLKIPFSGLISYLAGNIIIDNRPSINNRATQKILNELGNGTSLVIYPEGTRSRDSKIGKFRNGAFKIIKHTHATVVPVLFDNWNVIRPGGIKIRDLNVYIKLLDPIQYNEYKDLSIKDFSNLVRARLIKALIQLRDRRRKLEPEYYRNLIKYRQIDQELAKEINQ